MVKRVVGGVFLALLWLPVPRPAGAAEPAAPADEFFEREVRPLLVERCLSCHDDNKSKGDLKLTSRATLLQGGKRGAAVVPGKPDDSVLVRAIRYADAPKMPPTGKLADREIDVLTRWVAQGAPWPATAAPLVAAGPVFAITDEQRRFWSFQPVKDPTPPAVKDAAWNASPVDHFLQAKREEKGLIPVSLADKRTLLRRVTFDLTGLPPTPEEADAFLKDESPAAFEKVVDRLLASPAYGERWARHWLDVAHYADTAGETADYPVPDAWRYRNYVIDAFNADKPYDQFVREQVAGDLLAAEGPREHYGERLVATGFLAGARRFGFDPQNYQHLTIDDTIDTVGKAFLGLTVACARCHDHKFDPISRADYYALYGIFDSTRYPFPGSEESKRPRDLPSLPPPAEAEALRKPFEEELARLDKEVKALAAANTARVLEYNEAYDKKDNDRTAAARAAMAGAEQAYKEAKQRRDAFAAKPPVIETAYAVAEGTGHTARILLRGDPLTPGAEAPRRFLQILGGQELPPGEKGSGRRQLADWLSSPKNPLTARVMVNRVWQHHFGQGLVRTPNNFGKQGRPPTHPELLDYLTARFVESGWSVKALHKLILLSRTYQLSSSDDSRNRALDPDDELLWCFERRRLDAEAVRDSLLAVSGALDRTAAGPHPFPPASTWNFTQHAPFQAVYDTNRRSVYLMAQRTRRHPFLALFDGPDANQSTAERPVTTVPTQALFFLNDPFVHDQSARFADHLLKAEADEPRRIDLAHRLALGRPATAEEQASASAYLRKYLRELEAAGVPADRRPAAAWASYARVLFAGNEFVYVD